MEPGKELDELAHQVIGAAIAVHRELGPGLLPHTYSNALSVEMNLLGLPFAHNLSADVFYKGVHVGEGLVDFQVKDTLVVAVRAVDVLTPLDTAKVIAYLKILKKPLGLLMNFNVAVLKEGIRRIVLSQYLRHD